MSGNSPTQLGREEEIWAEQFSAASPPGTDWDSWDGTELSGSDVWLSQAWTPESQPDLGHGSFLDVELRQPRFYPSPFLNSILN
jgi:hypothetical protein